MADIKWIKLAVGLYKDRKFRQLRRKKGGDTLALIWIMLLCLAGDVNDHGRIYAADGVPFSDDDLADEFGVSEKMIADALNTFEELQIISRDSNVIIITNWEKHQDVTKLEMIKKNNAERQKKFRDRQRDSNVMRNVTHIEKSHVISNGNNALEEDEEEDIEQDIEQEKERKKYTNTKENGNYTRSARFTPPDIDSVSAFVKENGYAIDPQRFIDYYESNGWKVGKNPMRDWKAAVRGWASRDSSRQNEAVKNNPVLNYAQREYKDEDFGDDFFFDVTKWYEENYGDKK